MNPDPHCTGTRHGTVYAYRNFRCRCQATRDLIAKEKAKYRIRQYVAGPQLVDKTGTLRRVQGLMWLGWPAKVIAERVGYKRPEDLVDPTRMISRTYADRIKALYDEIGLEWGPSNRVRVLARKRGYQSPLAWDEDEIDNPSARPKRNPRTNDWDGYWHIDEVAVTEAMAGRRVKLTKPERREVVRRLQALGLGQSEIAWRLGITVAAAERLRSRTNARKDAA